MEFRHKGLSLPSAALRNRFALEVLEDRTDRYVRHIGSQGDQ